MAKKIGLLTSGGDCAGLNAAIRAVVTRAHHYGWETIGIKYGTRGLLQNPLDTIGLNLNYTDQALLRQGGTILGAINKNKKFDVKHIKTEADEVIKNYHKLGLDALIGIGGDGSQKILSNIAQKGNFNLVVIPKTIDNDVGCTENSIGFMSAVNIATEAIDRLQSTAESHERVMVVEVMGRDAGHIALSAGLAGGADIILIPEIPYTIDNIISKINQIYRHGKSYAMIVVSEAVNMETGKKSMIQTREGQNRYSGIGSYLADRLGQLTGIETRCTVLGHVQRGGAPVFQDRILATAFGVHAVDLIAQNKFNRMVGWDNGSVVDVDLKKAISNYKSVDVKGTLVKTARALNISFGDYEENI